MKANIITRPYMTEKSLSAASRGFYTFVVDDSVNKAEIADAVHRQYNVTVVDVRTMRVTGKMRRVGRKMRPTQKPDWKKAIVVLAPGQKIDAFDVSHEGEKK